MTGPIQVFVVGFDKFEATGRILAELRRVRKRGVIRVIDTLFVQKAAHGDIENTMHLTDRSEDERMRLGAIAGGHVGLAEGGLEGAEAGALAVAERDVGLSVDRLIELGESIPAGRAAAILVSEHHWATDLCDAIKEAGGRTLMQAMVAAELIEEAAKEEAEDAVRMSLDVEDAAVEEEAAERAVAAMVTAELIEEEAAEEALATVLATEEIEAEA